MAERFKLYSVSELLAFRPRPWLIDGLIPEGSMSVLYGPSGGGKSFFALDLGLSLSTAHGKWGVREKRTVAYIAAEGVGGLGTRVRAWMAHHGLAEEPSVWFVREAAQLRDPADLTALLERLKALDGLALVIVDTVARSFVGGEENSSKDVGEFVHAVTRIQEATGAAVLLVHHTGKGHNQDVERGSSALRAAADVMLLCRKQSDGTLVIKNDKQKDAEEAEPIRLVFKPISLSPDPETGQELSSIVLVPSVGGGVDDLTVPSKRAGVVLEALKGLPDRKAKCGAWQDAAKAAGVSPSTFDRTRKSLLSDGLVARDGEFYLVAA